MLLHYNLLIALPSAVVRVTVRSHPREVAVEEMLIQTVATSPSATEALLFTLSNSTIPAADLKGKKICSWKVH